MKNLSSLKVDKVAIKTLVLLTLILSSFLISCTENFQKTEKGDQNPILIRKINSLGNYALPVDDETAFDGLQNIQVTKLNDQEFLSYYNRPNHTIYLHDYLSKKLRKKITFSEGRPQ